MHYMHLGGDIIGTVWSASLFGGAVALLLGRLATLYTYLNKLFSGDDYIAVDRVPEVVTAGRGRVEFVNFTPCLVPSFHVQVQLVPYHDLLLELPDPL